MAKDKKLALDTKMIDELYDFYCDYHASLSYEKLLSAIYSSPKQGGGTKLIENLNKYIETYSQKVSSMYSSINKQNKEFEQIESIVYAMENITIVVDYLLTDYDAVDNERTGRKHYHEEIFPNDMFVINTELMKDGYKKYKNSVDLSEYEFNKTLEMIEFLRKEKSIKKVFGKTDWKNMSTNEILIALKDFHKEDQDKFEIKEPKNMIKEMLELKNHCFFTKIKRYCENMFVAYDKYRPTYVSLNSMMPEMDKLVFCENLKQLYEKGLFVDRNGALDCRTYFLPNKIIEDFRKKYNTKFDEKAFKTTQANVIFNPDINFGDSRNYMQPTQLVNMKNIQTQKGLIIGALLSNNTEEIYYLVHIKINDLHSDKCSYEIQLNLLPDGNIDNRIQLMRIDNYATKQAHNNIGGKRLETTTHVHLYNQFDLMRGKKNGNYDISHNLENVGTDFNTALHSFFAVMDLDVSLYNEIKKKIDFIKKRRLKQELELLGK